MQGVCKVNPNPSCDKECRFMQDGPSTTTMAYYPPVYDKSGNNINPDRNITSGSIVCVVCNKKWSYATQLGETVYKEW